MLKKLISSRRVPDEPMKSKPKSKPQFQQRKYTQLLNVLLLNFLASPLLKGSILSLVPSALLIITIILVIRTFYSRKWLYFIHISIAVLSFCLEVAFSLGWLNQFNVTTRFLLCSQIIVVLYLGLAIWLMVREIFFQTDRVTRDILRGGICVYFLIGFFWALLYTIVATLHVNAFSETFQLDSAHSRAVYLSFTTLTTLGYGDILPISEVALVLTNMEAIVGQLYPAIFISVLVGDYMAHRSKAED